MVGHVHVLRARGAGELRELAAVLRDRYAMLHLIPAAVFLFGDWALYIVAVRAGRILDVSLAYYLNPLLNFAVGMLFFREKCGPAHYAALALAAAGVAVSAIGFHTFPWMAVAIAVNWMCYSVVKKHANAPAVGSFAVEMLMLLPLAMVFLAGLRSGANGLGTISVGNQLFWIGAGVVTALPMLLFSRSVTRLPLVVLSLIQFLSPTLNVVCGLLTGETISGAKLVSFLFIWAGLLVFAAAELRAARRESLQEPAEQS